MSSESHPDGTESAPTSDRWAAVSRRVANSLVRANDAFISAMAVLKADVSTDPSPTDGVAFDDETWTFERSVDDQAALGVGDYVRFTKTVDAVDVSTFARASGDTNRLHLEEEFAAGTQFGGRIAHGTLVAGTISAALARLPGTTISLSQDLEFQAPVEIGAVVTADCEIVEDLGEDRYRLHTAVRTDEETVIDGEAVVMVTAAAA